MSVPVYVNVFNRLTLTRKLCEQIAALDGAVPIIIDNNSTWEPLVDWYQHCPFEVIRLTDNYGHHAPWRAGITARPNNGLYCVTDCDLDLQGVPADLMDVLRHPLTSWNNPPVKSGVALRIDEYHAIAHGAQDGATARLAADEFGGFVRRAALRLA